MLKILQIIPSLSKGGAERLVLDICNELYSRVDIEVCLVIFRNENEYPFLSNDIHIKIIPSKVIPSMSGKPTMEINELMHFINEFKPNVIHSHLFEAEIVSRWQIIAGVKYFTHCHDNMHQLQNFHITDIFSKKRITELYEKWIILKKYKESENKFIAISLYTKEYFNSSLPHILRKNINLLLNAINYNKFTISKNKENNNSLSLISVGRLDKNKNQIFLLEVVKILKKRNINLYLTLIGNGSEKKKIEEKAEALDITNCICFIGFSNDIPSYLSKADVYVHSALSEAFGLTIVEAMASGLPVVSLNGGGNADLIENGKNGFLINKPDSELFAEKIIELWENKNLYNQMSSYAQEFAKQYDIKEYVDKLLELYRN